MASRKVASTKSKYKRPSNYSGGSKKEDPKIDKQSIGRGKYRVNEDYCVDNFRRRNRSKISPSSEGITYLARTQTIATMPSRGIIYWYALRETGKVHRRS